MFTGLVQSLGTLERLAADRLKISCDRHQAAPLFPNLEIGDSVAVDGVCLTVEVILSQGFIVTVSPETLRRTTLEHQIESQGYVNLETSLRVGSKIGGHFVTGHVDGTGHLKTAIPTATSWEMTFTAAPEVARYIVSKGSIAVNGVSLTVAECDRQGLWFTVAVIPHTYQATNLHRLQPGSLVNLEGDILGKYVEKFVSTPSTQFPEVSEPPLTFAEITPAFLSENGY